MNLITPDSGLLFWMVIIFGLVFFLLAKFGFPVITSMVEKRNRTIEQSLSDAREIETRMTGMVREQERMLEEAKKEQSAILKEAAAMKARIVAEAEVKAREEAGKILSEARAQIAAEKESALRDVRKEVALLSVSVAEKILRRDLSEESAQKEYVDRLVDEAARLEVKS